jgi:mRNA deadenylase 3'-5' endonuclease subunit Ccr4
LLFYQPDIVCLQEIDENEEIITKWLESHGYFYEYKSRTREKTDGCLTAFKKSRFELQESKYIEFFKDEDEVVLNRDNIA